MQTVEYRVVTILNNELYQTVYRNHELVKFIRNEKADRILMLPFLDNAGFMIAEEMEESL